MAFKMKGSPAKMGKIQGTAGHTSALKQAGDDKSRYGRVKTPYDADRSPKPPTQMKSPVKQKYERVNPTENNPEGKDVKVTTKRGKTKTYSKNPNLASPGLAQGEGVTKTTSRKVGFLEGLLTKKKKGDVVTKTKQISENKAMNQLERAKNKADRKGVTTAESLDKTGDDYKATTTKKKKKLFGGKKTTTTSTSYLSGEPRKRGTGDTVVTHSRKKKRGGGVKKTVTIDAETGKKTIKRYDKEGNLKRTKVRKGDHRQGMNPNKRKEARAIEAKSREDYVKHTKKSMAESKEKKRKKRKEKNK